MKDDSFGKKLSPKHKWNSFTILLKVKKPKNKSSWDFERVLDTLKPYWFCLYSQFCQRSSGCFKNPPEGIENSLKLIQSLWNVFSLKQFFKSSNFAFMQNIHFLLRNITKIGLVFFQPRYKTLHVPACIVSYWGWKKVSLNFVIFLNKKWIFFIKAKLLLLKSSKIIKEFQSDLINLKFLSRPSGGFLKQ